MSTRSPFTKKLSANGFNANYNPMGRGASVIKSDEQRAIESKLISPANASRTPQQKGPDGTPFPNSQLANTVINDTAQNIVDARNLTRLLPDVKVARMLLVSAIQSPNDLVSCSLSYVNDDDEFGNAKAGLLEIIEDAFESLHKIDELIPVLLDEILFEKGAVGFITLSESGFDDIVNADLTKQNGRMAMESLVSKMESAGGLFEPTGLLGNPPPKDEPNEKYKTQDVFKRANKLMLAHESTTGVVSLPKADLKQDRAITFRVKEKDKEDAKVEIKYRISDNTDILKVGKLNERLALEEARLRLRDQFGVSFHDITAMDLDEYSEEEEEELATESGLFNGPVVTQSGRANDAILNFNGNEAHGIVRQRNYSWNPVRAVNNHSRKNIGEPTVIKVPADCIIPVYLHGRPDEQIGSFLALEQTGGFVQVTDDTDHYREMQTARDSSDGASSQMIDQVHQSTYGSNQQRRLANIREEQQLLSSAVLNHSFLGALEHGAYKGLKLALGNTDGISRLMLSRALSGDNTHFLFVPKDLFTYIAFDYNDYGCGISLLAQNKMQGAIRAMMQFTNTQTAINNAIIHTRIDVTFDEFESDPERTIEQIYHEAIRRRVSSYPLGVSSPLTQLEYLAVAGTTINVENHPSYPGTKVDFDYFNNSISEIPTEFTDQLKRDFLQGLGINPESIDMSMGVELAQSIVTSNLLLAKRALIYQGKFCAGLTDHLKKYVIHSPAVRKALVTYILQNKENFKGKKYYKALEKGDKRSEELANKLALKFLSSTYVELPKPDLNTMEMQLAAIETKDAFYDNLVNYVISPDFIAEWEVGDTVSNALEHFRAMYKNYLMRQYIQEENIAPELFTLLGFDEGNEKIVTLLEANKEYNERLGRFFAGYMKESSKNAEKTETIATNAGQNDLAEGGDDGYGSDDYNSFSSDSGGYDDFSFDSDDSFGGGMDGDFMDDSSDEEEESGL